MSEVNLELAREGDVVLARLEGELDLSNSSEVGEKMARAVSNDAVGLAVDLSAVRYMDSAGIRMLFDLARDMEATRQVMSLVLTDGSPLRKVITVTRLDAVAPLCESVEECVSVIRRSSIDRM